MENIAIHEPLKLSGGPFRSSEALYRSIVEIQSDLICRFLPDSTITFVNEAYCRFYNKKPHEIIGTRFLDLLSDTDSNDIRTLIATVQSTGVSATREQALIRWDGEIVWHQWINLAITNDKGIVTELQGIGRDITDRKLVEAALRESKSNFKDMADSLPILVYKHGPDGTLTFGNKALLEFHNVEMEELASTDLTERFHPEHRERITQALAKALETRQPYSGDFQMRAHNEEKYRWFYKVIIPQFAESGAFLGLLGSCIDITDLKISHEELRASEERYRNVVESQHEFICRYLPDGTLTFVNDAYCKYFQKSREELLGVSFFTLLPEEERPPIQEFVTSLVLQPRHEPLQHKVIMADGSIGWHEWVDHTILDSEGRFVELQGIGRDITPQKRAEAALRSSEERFQAFMKNIPAAAWITDSNTRILYANETFKKRMEALQGSLEGKTVFDLFPEDEEKARQLAIKARNVAETGETVEYYDEMTLPDGSVHSSLVYKFSLDVEERGSRRIGGLSLDITPLKEAELRIKESEELFRTLLADLEIGVVVYDGTANVLLANQAALDMFGLTSDDVVGKPVCGDDWITYGEDGSLVPPNERPAAIAINTGTPVRGAIISMFRSSMPSPKWCQIDAIPILDESGNLKHVVSTYADITAMKEANEELKASRNEYRRIVTTAYEGVWTLDLKGTTIFTNERFAEMLGYTVDEIKGMAAADLIDADLKLKAILEPARRPTETRLQFDARFRHKSGSEVWGLISAAALYEVTGNRTGSLLMVTDITSRKAAEDQIQGMTARILKLQDDERRRIALALHDDTGQELSVLNINLSVLKKRFDEGSVESYEIGKCQIHLDKVLKELRTLSYLLHPPMLDDAGLISALRWFVDGFSRRSDIPVSLKLDESIGRLPTEVETALYRVVQEALTNVHRHSNTKTAFVSLVQNAREIRLRIVDRGKGMPVERGGDLDVTSLGVGIMGMKQRLAQLGGTLEIRSSARGTTVIASVPRRVES